MASTAGELCRLLNHLPGALQGYPVLGQGEAGIVIDGLVG